MPRGNLSTLHHNRHSKSGKHRTKGADKAAQSAFNDEMAVALKKFLNLKKRDDSVRREITAFSFLRSGRDSNPRPPP